jgi:1-acyl-sn-glycerol-3-phosphate acyltransferase
VKNPFGILSFAFKLYLGFIFVLTAILFFPALAFTTSREKYYPATHRLFVAWSRVFRIFAGWKLQIKNNQTLAEGPFIIVANHASYADIFITPSLFYKYPHVFLGKSEILSYPIIKHYFKGYHVPVFRDNKMKAAKSLIHARKKLKDGWSLIIFPEGGIPDNERPTMIPFKDGAFKLAKDTKTPILPVTFVNNYELFTDPTDFFESCRPGISKIIFHPIISAEEIEEKSVEELKQQAFDLIQSGLSK